MRRRLIVSAASVASIALGTMLLSVSPPSCSCETPLMEFGWEVGLFTPPDYALPDDIVPDKVQAAASEKYRGQSLESLRPPEAMRVGACEKQPNVLVCTYAISSGPLREEHMILQFMASGGGGVSEVIVSQESTWHFL